MKVRYKIISWIASILLLISGCSSSEPPETETTLPPPTSMTEDSVPPPAPEPIVATLNIKPDTLPVNTPVKWEITTTISEGVVEPGGKILIRLPKSFLGATGPQILDPNQPWYLSARRELETPIPISAIEKSNSLLDWDLERFAWIVTLDIVDEPLEINDQVFLTVGTDLNTEKTSNTAVIEQVDLAIIDHNGALAISDQKADTVELISGNRSRLITTIPSRSIVNELIVLKVSTIDTFRNFVPGYSEDFNVFIENVVSMRREEVGDLNVENGTALFDHVFDSAGFYRLVIQGKLPPNHIYYSNPIQVSETELTPIFWGDLHTHTNVSHDGLGINGFQYAKNVAFLDFHALTDHTSSDARDGKGGITPSEWQQQLNDVMAFHEPGKFVTFPGYEFSDSAPWGHHNVIFNTPQEHVHETPLFREDEIRSVDVLWQATIPTTHDFTTIPHHTGILWNPFLSEGPLTYFGDDWKNTERRHLIEVMSNHGQSELNDPEHPFAYGWLHGGIERGYANGPHYAQNAWSEGEHIGVIASSDDHSAKPGVSVPIAAVFAQTLDRDTIFSALKHKHTYGTSGGARIIVDFSIDGSSMGQVIKKPLGSEIELKGTVVGTSPLSKVEVLKWDSSRDASGADIFTPVYTVDLSSFVHEFSFNEQVTEETAVYYVRVIQAPFRNRSEMAWSSPIRIER